MGVRLSGTLEGNFQYCLWHQRHWAGSGIAYPAGADFHAFITGLNGINMTDLNSLVSFGGILTNATAINSHGQVAVMGNVSKPETCAMLLAGLGLGGVIARAARLLKQSLSYKGGDALLSLICFFAPASPFLALGSSSNLTLFVRSNPNSYT